MKIGKDQLRPIETPLVGFAGTSVYPLGMITLQIIAGAYPKQATKKVKQWPENEIREMRGATKKVKLPTYHLLVRFPTENEIGEMKGD